MLLYMRLYINLQAITSNMYACGCVHTGDDMSEDHKLCLKI